MAARYVWPPLRCSLGSPGLSAALLVDVLKLVKCFGKGRREHVAELDFRDVVLDYLAAGDHQTRVVLDRGDTVGHDGYNAGRRAGLLARVAPYVLNLVKCSQISCNQPTHNVGACPARPR